MTSDLIAAVQEALGTLTEAGHPVDAIFGDRSTLPEQLESDVAYAVGIVDGAGIALGLTAIELLDELGMLPNSET